MSTSLVLEICVEAVDLVVAAERGGAHRVELCTDLSSGGVTPSAGLMQTARRHVRIPIHVLIRPRPGNFCYSDQELEIMGNDIHAAKQFGMDGVVLGVLQENAHVDVERTRALVDLAHPLPVTFHRAFDASENLDLSLEDVIQTGASRILTSGGQPRATDALSPLAKLAKAARQRILIMPCGGINATNIVRIARNTLAHEFHSSVGTSHLRSTGNGSRSSRGSNAESPSTLFEQKVAKLVSLLQSVAHDDVRGK